MKTILVTGSLGLTGSACVDKFKSEGWYVIGVDANLRAKFFGTEEQHESNSDINYYVDLRDEEGVEGIFKDRAIDAIIHTAGQPSHDWATDNVLTDFDVNARASVILFEMARKHCPNAVIIHVSTDKVYGENMTTPVVERETRYEGMETFDESVSLDYAGDRSFFGCSKTAADLYAQQYSDKLGMKIVVFRPGCITGRKHQGAPQHGFLAYLAKCIREGLPYHVHGNGKQVRDNIHASDLANAFYEVVINYNPKALNVYNIGGGPERAISLLEASEMMCRKSGKTANLIFGAPFREGDRIYDVHDVSRFRHDYPHWDYKYDLQAIIDDLI